jgi:uncharacterized protein (DUF885 family)
MNRVTPQTEYLRACEIGQLRVLSLRVRAECELGAAFDLREFHDQLLAEDAVPLAVLTQQVTAWIASKN